MKNFIAIIKAWSTLKKISVFGTAAAVIIGVGAVSTYVMHSPTEEEPVIEEIPEIAITTSQDVIVKTVEISADSMEKDMSIYLTDVSEEKIVDGNFQVKIVRAGDMDSDSEITATQKAEEIKKSLSKYLSYEEDQDELDTEGSSTKDLEDGAKEDETEDEAENEEKKELLPERTYDSVVFDELLAEYDGLVEGLEGQVVSDDDNDGLIHVEDLEPGFYYVYYMSGNSCFPDTPMIGAEVKEKVEFKPVKEIEKKVVTYSASQDVSGHATATESVTKDTIKFIDSKQTVLPTTYSKATAVKPAAGVTGEATSIKDNTGADVATVSNSGANLYAVNGLNTVNIPASGISNAVSNNENVAKVSHNGNSINITAKSSGTAIITCSADYKVLAEDGSDTGETQQGTTTVTVNVGDSSSPLKDSAGNNLFVDAQGMRAATIADYTDGAVFYAKSTEESVIYQGWQTINGNRYFYDASGKPVTGEQVISGVRYTFGNDGKLLSNLGAGIDVSKWQGNINWSQVKASGINFAIIRCGGRYKDARTLYKDPNFAANMKGATANGIKVGVYCYSTALNDAEAVEEASLAISMAKGYSVSLPIFIDMEDSIQNGLTTAQRTSIATAFCETVRSSGYSAGVYANYSWWTSKLNASALSKYRVWIARYSSTLGYSGKYDIWQYSSKGTVPGIKGEVDVNIAYF